MPSLDSVCFADELERWRRCKMPGGDETKTVEVGVWKETPPLPSDVRNRADGFGPGKYRLLSYKAKSRPGPTSTFHIREDEEKASPVYDERAHPSPGGHVEHGYEAMPIMGEPLQGSDAIGGKAHGRTGGIP